MMKSDEFDEDKYGFSALPSGLFIERKNVGWCGTPPVTYGNYEGRWKGVSKKKINIEVKYWGGIMKYSMEIVSLSSDVLEFKLADVEYS